MDPRHALGRGGEAAAAHLYENLGYAVIERNFRCSSGEIDIVARKDDELVFSEVKTRRSDRWGQPCEAVDHRKRARLRRLAAEWMAKRRPGDVVVHFDVVSVIVTSDSISIERYADAF